MGSRRFEDKVALVTGGNSGMGLAAARALSDEGATVIITGRNPETLEQARAQLGKRALTITADVSKLDQLDRVMAEIRERTGRIDVLFANAGVASFGPIASMTEERFDELVNVNLKGLYFTVQKSLPLMKQGGAIVLNASVAAGRGRPGGSVYGATKAAVRALGRSLGAELVGAGIRVNVVSPGPIETPIFGRTGGMSTDAVTNMKADWTAGNPMKRFGTPDEVAAAVLFLASDQASFITGVDLLVDGGLGSF